MNTSSIHTVVGPPERTVSVSFKVSLRHKNKEGDIILYANQIIEWYKKGCIDFPSIHNFNICYNSATAHFDVTFTYGGDDEYISIRLADSDSEGHFPIIIDGLPYSVTGSVIN